MLVARGLTFVAAPEGADGLFGEEPDVQGTLAQIVTMLWSVGEMRTTAAALRVTSFGALPVTRMGAMLIQGRSTELTTTTLRVMRLRVVVGPAILTTTLFMLDGATRIPLDTITRLRGGGGGGDGEPAGGGMVWGLEQGQRMGARFPADTQPEFELTREATQADADGTQSDGQGRPSTARQGTGL